MSSKLTSTTAVIYSNDSKLEEAIQQLLLSQTQPGDSPAVDIHFKTEVGNTAKASNASVIVYDLDLLKNDVSKAESDILHLKSIEPSTTLIVVGRREQITPILSSKRVGSLVDRTVNKPLIASQLLLAINTAAQHPSHAEQAIDATTKSKTMPIAIGLLGGACAIAALVFMFMTGQQRAEPDLTVSTQVVDPILSPEKPDSVNGAGVEGNATNTKIARLERLASAALENGVLISNSGDDALSYYNRILEIDVFHDQAYKNKTDIIKQLRSSFPKLLEEGRLEHAGEVLVVLKKEEPFNELNREMERTLIGSGRNLQEPALADAGDATPQVSKSKADLESEAVKSISIAIESGKLTPPQTNSAYSQLLGAVQRGELGSQALESSKLKLLSALTIQAQQYIDSADTVSASRLAGYIANIDSRHPALKDLRTALSNKNRSAEDATPSIVASPTPSTTPARIPAKAAVEPVKPKILPYKIISRVEPKYPRKAYNLDIEGWVELSFQVDENGKAVNIEVVDAEPKKIFDKSGVRALENWQFSPAKNSITGEAKMSDKATTIFNFSLSS